jgi:hypothetical protein
MTKLGKRILRLVVAHPWALTSLALLALVAVTWPELFVYRKFLMLPAWAKHLPAPGHAGVYLSTAALVLVTWGTREFKQAIISTFWVCLLAAVAAVMANVLGRPWSVHLAIGSALDYSFVLFARFTAPALALLALRWAVRTWVRL